MAETPAEESMVSPDKSYKQRSGTRCGDGAARSDRATDLHGDGYDAHSGPGEEARHLQPALRVLAAIVDVYVAEAFSVKHT